ncbi:MAG: HEPN domain-containing protein [Chitinophagaceae bacterium]
MYNLLTRDFISQHTELARIIIEAAAPEKIYLLGCSISHVRTESIFAYNQPTCRNVSHYYVLALVDKKDAESCVSMQDKIENNCQHFIPVTAIVLDIHQFNEWLTEGHFFANKICRMAECIHDAEHMRLAIPKDIDEQELAKTNESLYSTGINKVQEFLAGADLFRLREQNKMAAFMLHQAAEQVLQTLFRITTGLYIHSHNLDKLFRYCSMVSYKLPAIFPRNNEKNERLFQLLQRAYIDTRYKDDYVIRTDDLLLITERVRNLLEILKNAIVI